MASSGHVCIGFIIRVSLFSEHCSSLALCVCVGGGGGGGGAVYVFVGGGGCVCLCRIVDVVSLILDSLCVCDYSVCLACPLASPHPTIR